MAIWNGIIAKLKEILYKMTGPRTIEKSLNISPTISTRMTKAISLWSDMYGDRSPWVHEPSAEDPTRVVSLGLPAMIASEKARTALIELASEITTPMKEVEKENPKYMSAEPDELGNIIPSREPKFIKEEVPKGPTERATFLNSQYKKLKRQLRKQIEYGVAKGGIVFKPYVVMAESGIGIGNKEFNVSIDDASSDNIDSKYSIEFDYVQADSFLPLTFDAAKRITEAAFIQSKIEQNVIYRRLEYHKWENNRVTIINRAFKATNISDNIQNSSIELDLGEEIPLNTVPEWSTLQPETTIENVDRPLFAYFRMPEANTVDTVSPLGVSGFSRAVNLIRDADYQYSRLLWEYEAGEMAINVDRDAFTWMTDDTATGTGHSEVGKMQARLYRRMDISEGELFEPYAPALRDNNYIEGLNAILMRIEDVVGISRGTLSDSIDIARTATELKILKQRSYQTNADIQEAIQNTLEDVIYIMNIYCDLYEITPPGEYDVNFEWDDSLIVDTDAELEKRIVLQQNGIVSKVENRMWYFGETERQAQEALLKIAQEEQQSMESDLVRETNEIMQRRQEGEFKQKRNNEE